jgi:ribosomal protein L30/L7E
VSIGYHQTVCRSMTLRYTAHVQIYTFTANNKGMINHTSKKKNVF